MKQAWAPTLQDILNGHCLPRQALGRQQSGLAAQTQLPTIVIHQSQYSQQVPCTVTLMPHSRPAVQRVMPYPTLPCREARLEERRVVVLDAQVVAHRAHVARRAPQAVPRQVREQVVPGPSASTARWPHASAARWPHKRSAAASGAQPPVVHLGKGNAEKRVAQAPERRSISSVECASRPLID